MEVKSKQMQTTFEVFFQSENYQYMEQVASQCHGGFLRQLLQGTTERLEQGCETISDAYIHYCLQVTFLRVAELLGVQTGH